MTQQTTNISRRGFLTLGGLTALGRRGGAGRLRASDGRR